MEQAILLSQPYNSRSISILNYKAVTFINLTSSVVNKIDALYLGVVYSALTGHNIGDQTVGSCWVEVCPVHWVNVVLMDGSRVID